VIVARVVQGNVTATQGSVIVVTMLLERSVIVARQSTMVSIPVRDVWHAIASLRLRVHSAMIRPDSAVASQVLQVACVNAVRLASGTIAEMDACLAVVTPTTRLGLGAIQTRVNVSVCRV